MAVGQVGIERDGSPRGSQRLGHGVARGRHAPVPAHAERVGQSRPGGGELGIQLQRAAEAHDALFHVPPAFEQERAASQIQFVRLDIAGGGLDQASGGAGGQRDFQFFGDRARDLVLHVEDVRHLAVGLDVADGPRRISQNRRSELHGRAPVKRPHAGGQLVEQYTERKDVGAVIHANP